MKRTTDNLLEDDAQKLREHYEALEEARDKINQTKKKIYNRYTVGLMLAAASIAVVTTVFFPPSLAVGLVGLAFKATVYASFSISSYLGYELVTQNSIKNNPYEGFSFVTPIANFFGAKKVIDHLNKDHRKEIAFHNEQIVALKEKLKTSYAKVDPTKNMGKAISQSTKKVSKAISQSTKKVSQARTNHVNRENTKRSKSSQEHACKYR